MINKVDWFDKNAVIKFANRLGPGWIVWKHKDDLKYNATLASVMGSMMPTAKEIIIVHRT